MFMLTKMLKRTDATGTLATPGSPRDRAGMTPGRALAWTVAAGLGVGIDAPVDARGDCEAPAVDAFAVEGDPAPGTTQSFQTFDRPVVSSSGAVCFTADTDGSTATDDVVYAASALIAREGDPAPGVVGGSFGVFEFFETHQQINASGGVVFITTLRDVPADASRALFVQPNSGTTGGVQLVAQEGASVPGIADRSYADMGFAGIADDGTVGFLADLDGTTSDDSVIMFGETVLYREGDSVPELDGVTWDGNFDEVQWNGRGDVLFEGNTSLPGASDRVLFRRLRSTDGVTEESIVAQEGDAVDARTGPDALAAISQTALAENGAWALRGTLAAAPVGQTEFIMTDAGVVAQEGDPVSVFADVFLGTLGALGINGFGDVVFLADLEGATPEGVDEGLFVNGCLLATTGTPAPGLPEGTVFADFGFEDVAINDDGIIALAASYSGATSGDGVFTIVHDATGGCLADLDGNGVVGFGDLLTILADWGPCTGPCASDIDADGTVGITDMQQVVAAWGPCGGTV